jgi:hypothetical protein
MLGSGDAQGIISSGDESGEAMSREKSRLG